jgi:glycosyltransferase involved in cell wall biosynthesis
MKTKQTINPPPLVAIIIPMFNVERFIQSCLESVIHQTYSNLLIIIVDDGSTDNSVSYAFPYLDQDERVTLILKKNGGQSTARNVAMDYIFGNCELRPLTLSNIPYISIGVCPKIQPPCFDKHFFKISANLFNKLFFSSAFESQNSFLCISQRSGSPPKPDYIIFLDGDDRLELNCIESSMLEIEDSDLFWFDFRYEYPDNIDDYAETPLLELLHIEESEAKTQTFTGLEILRRTGGISLACGALIKSSALLSLRFYPSIRQEDKLFGIQLLLGVKRLKVSNERLYIYNVRHNTTSFHSEVYAIDEFPTYLQMLVFQLGSVKSAKKYHYVYSIIVIVNKLESLLEEYEKTIDHSHLANTLEKVIVKLAPHCFEAATFYRDPLQLRDFLRNLKRYAHLSSLRESFALRSPKLYFILRTFKNGLFASNRQVVKSRFGMLL